MVDEATQQEGETSRKEGEDRDGEEKEEKEEK